MIWLPVICNGLTYFPPGQIRMWYTEQSWFTEPCTECGTALSFEIHKKLHEEQTPFQTIEIYSTKSFGKMMAIDGFVMLTERDNFIYHEMLAHPVLFSHPEPAEILIVGGGDCGTLREVAKHGCVLKILQVEIDERVTRLSEKYFPELCESNHDPRIEFIFEDATEWIQKRNPESVDVIIVDSTDPIGPAQGLFSTPFYKDCFHALRNDGLLVQQSESPLVHLESIIRPMHAFMRKAGFAATELIHFPQPCYPTGWWTATIASKTGQLTCHRPESARHPGFETRYYNHAIHFASLSVPQFMQDSKP